MIIDSNIMEYQQITYNDRIYMVCKYYDRHTDNESGLFVINSDKFKIPTESSQYVLYGNHICYRMNGFDGKHKYINMLDVITRNAINNNTTKKFVNQKNGIIQDLRRENLRLVNLNILNELKDRNQVKKVPKGSNLDPADIPKCIQYNSALQQFAISFVHDGEKYYIPLVSSKSLSIEGKLEHAKMNLIKFANENPELAQNKQLIENHSNRSIQLMKDFNNILLLTGFDRPDNSLIINSLIIIPRRQILTIKLNHLSESDKQILENTKITDGTGRRCTTKLPDDCRVNIADLPKYCYYRPGSTGRGDYFFVKNHPNLERGKSLLTSGSQSVTIDQKYAELLSILRKLEDK